LTADAGTEVQGVVGLAPVTDFLADTKRRGGLSTSLKGLLNETEADDRVFGILKGMSPLTYVHRGAPPFLLLQGSADKTVPPEQTEAFSKKLKEDGVEVEYDAVANAPHAILSWDKTDGSYRGKLTAWLEKTVGGVQNK
jgi:dipeptidyl aminopeptidase/acylaminoacyl peptidase